nr:integrase, catalytic core [Tanacetum cinerariifolium]
MTYKFLMGLDDQVSVIKTQILAMKPAPKLSIVYHLVVEDEQQRKGKWDKPRPRAAMVERKPYTILGMMEEQYAMFLKLFGENRDEHVIANMAGNMSVNDSWVVDSGAIENITHQGYLLKNLFINTTGRPVTIPNGESIPVKGKGFGSGELDWISDCRGSLYWMGGIKEERKNIENNKEEQTHSMEEVLQEQPEDLAEEKENVQSENVHVENMHMENHVEPPVI